MNTPFQLAPDAQTRDIECGQFSRTAEGAPFCACLKHPYCCGVGESPETCSFKTPKEQGPYKPKEKQRGDRNATRSPAIEGYSTISDVAEQLGAMRITISKWIEQSPEVLRGHTAKFSGTLYIDDFGVAYLTQRNKRKKGGNKK